MARPEIPLRNLSYDDRRQEMRTQWLADEADRNAVSEESNCSLLSFKK